METKEKAIKIIEEMMKVQESKKLSWEKAATLVKGHYGLSDKQFAGMLMLVMS
jgi:hypothetical protein